MQALIVVAVTVIAVFLVAFLYKKVEWLNEETDCLTARRYITEADNAAATAVGYVAQTYTDTLKQGGAFTADSQREAFRRAFAETKFLLTMDAEQFILEEYGDVNVYLTLKIEAEVKRQKQTAAR